MPQFLTTSGTSHLIEDIIIRAKTDLVLITPYLKLSGTLFERLTEANRRGVRIRLVYGKEALRSFEKRQLDALTNLEMLFLKNLHAKCYLNENVLVVSSMNLYEFSEKNNREMGIVLTRQDDGECYADALAEAHSIMAAAQVVSVRKQVPNTSPLPMREYRHPETEAPASGVEESRRALSKEKKEYDFDLMAQKVYALLKQQPEVGTLFNLETDFAGNGKDILSTTITAESFPRRGIDFVFFRTISFNFEDSDNFQAVKGCQREKIEQQLGSDYRCYWNRDVIQIYPAQNYKRIDEQTSAVYFIKAILSVAGILKWYPHPVRTQRL